MTSITSELVSPAEAAHARPFLLLSPPRPSGFVLVLHGAGSSKEGAADAYGVAACAERFNVAVALPDGLPRDPSQPANFRTNPRIWDDGSRRAHLGETARDDLGHLEQVIARLSERFGELPVGVTGFSNGAAMAFRAGATLDRVQAVAPVSGHLWIPLERSQPLSVLFIAGDADPFNPMTRQTVVLPWGLTHTPPLWQDTLDRLAVASAGGPDVRDDGVTRHAVYPLRAGVRLTHVLVHGQGHEWPGGKRLLPPRVSGPSAPGFDASAEIFQFFSAQLVPAR